MFEDISILARLQDACINDSNEYRSDLLRSLPHIVVVGSQSVGKTSLLESLIGMEDVFPKGSGSMITRCAIALQLCYARDIEFEAELLTPNGQTTVYMNPAGLRQALERHMHGIDDWISDEVVRVKIKSAKTPDLCLMDLPGLIQLPSQDQPRDLDIRIRKLVEKFAASTRETGSIILAVTCATNDLANSDALRLARELDPLGERTIGVLTKCDLLVDPSSLRLMVDSTVRSKFPLKLGYVFVVNKVVSGRRVLRGASDLCSEPSSEARSQETTSAGSLNGDYFEQEAFRPVRSMCGIGALKARLTQVLEAGIRRFSDERYSQFRAELAEIDLELVTLGPEDSQVNGSSVILSVVSKYCRRIDDLLEGKVDDEQTSVVELNRAPRGANAYQLPSVREPPEEVVRSGDSAPPILVPERKHELVGGARLNFVFQDWFCASMMKLDGLDSMDDFEIRTAIRNSSGSSPSLFIPESVFETLIKKQIRRLENPVLQCVRQAVKELLAIFHHPLSTARFLELKKYPQLRAQISSVVKNCVAIREQKCIRQTQHLIHIQTAYINKAHPDFLLDKERIQKYFFRPHGGGPTRPNVRGATAPDDYLSNGSGAIPHSDPASWMNEPGPSTFMSFWRRHPLTGSHLKPRASLASPIPAAAQTQQPQHPTPNLNEQTPAPMSAGDHSPPLDQDTMLIEMVKMLIRSYFSIIKKSLADLVPKVIMYFLVNASREDVHEQLIVHLYKENVRESLLVESSEVAELRRSLLEKQRVLQEACSILESVARGS